MLLEESSRNKYTDVQQNIEYSTLGGFLIEMRPEAVTKAPLQQNPTQVTHQGDVKKHQLERTEQNH